MTDAETRAAVGAATTTCTHCPRRCAIPEDGFGFCMVRQNRGGRIVLTTYGETIGGTVDPMEKKPLYHYYPGEPILSYGSVGCNMGCTFCQNARISKTGDRNLLTRHLTPGDVAQAAVDKNCRFVAFTYNEPLVWAEFAVDAAKACRERGIGTVAVTAGYVSGEDRATFFEAMDAVNVDLKGFSDDFYRTEIGADFNVVKETLEYVARNTGCWLEVTTLLIPTLNDADDDLRRQGAWMVRRLGPETPLHLSAFHPAYRRLDLPPTPPETLFRARELFMAEGLRYVYTGNIHDSAGQSTYCPQCRQTVILRDGYRIEEYRIDGEGCCRFCGQTIAGRFSLEDD